MYIITLFYPKTGNLYVIRHMNNVIRHIYFDNLRKTSIFASRITNLEDSYLHTWQYGKIHKPQNDYL